jgi:hypothetical protein
METGNFANGNIAARSNPDLVKLATDAVLTYSNNNVKFALIFNGMGTNGDPNFKEFVIEDKGVKAIGSGGGRVGINFATWADQVGSGTIAEAAGYGYKYALAMVTGGTTPLFDQDPLGMMPADGGNYSLTKEYYEQLGNLNEVIKLIDILSTSSLSASLVESNDGITATVKPGITELFAGWLSCDDQVAKDLGLNCIAPYTMDTSNQNYVVDPLGEFLCSEGYEVGEVCQNMCIPNVLDGGSGRIRVVDGVTTCPLPGLHYCFQGPYGSYTHDQETDLPLDLWPDYTAPIDFTVVAPETGEVIEAYMSDWGYILVIKGNSGVVYKINHLELSKTTVQVGSKVTVGQEISEVWRGYGEGNYHIHVTGWVDEVNGQAIDPYYLYGQQLGCNAVAPPAGATEGTVLGRGPGYCVGSDSGKLYDNGYFEGKMSPVNSSIVSDMFVSTYGEEAVSDTIESHSQLGGIISSGYTDATSLPYCAPESERPETSCNEFNCFDGSTDFYGALECAASTLSNDIARGYSLDRIIDEYGPYCDNETVYYGNYFMPFAYNLFTLIYDKYLSVGSDGGRICTGELRSEPRESDINMSCGSLGSESRSPGYEPYDYYRGALLDCPIDTKANLGWTAATSKGRSPEELAQWAWENVSYQGMQLKDTPIQKVVEVMRTAKAKNVNPFLLLGIWATESWFGQSNKACNVYYAK